jgi:uncharacterized protein YuzE
MKFTYDARHNITYIAFRDKPDQIETIKISDEREHRLAPDSSIYGIELRSANEQLAGGRGMTVVNEALGTSTEVKLSA